MLELLDRMNPTIEELTITVEQEAQRWPEALRLMTHPGVGPLTALAFVLIIGTPERFHRGKQIGSYMGLIPSEDSSAGHQRLGHISKQLSTAFLASRSSASCGSLGFGLETSVEPRRLPKFLALHGGKHTKIEQATAEVQRTTWGKADARRTNQVPWRVVVIFYRYE